MDVSKNNGTPKSSILIGFSIINHPFLGYPYFRKHPYGNPPVWWTGCWRRRCCWLDCCILFCFYMCRCASFFKKTICSDTGGCFLLGKLFMPLKNVSSQHRDTLSTWHEHLGFAVRCLEHCKMILPTVWCARICMVTILRKMEEHSRIS